MNEEELTRELKKIKKAIAPLDRSKSRNIYTKIAYVEVSLRDQLKETNERIDRILKFLDLQFDLNEITEKRLRGYFG